MIQETFVIIKPEGVKRGLVGEIISRFERKGLTIKRIELQRIARETAREHYSHQSDKPYFNSIVEAFTAGDVVLLILEGDEAIKVVRNLIGKTNPQEAEPGTIRGDFGTVLPYNIVHASDCHEAFLEETARFFK